MAANFDRNCYKSWEKREQRRFENRDMADRIYQNEFGKVAVSSRHAIFDEASEKQEPASVVESIRRMMKSLEEPIVTLSSSEEMLSKVEDSIRERMWGAAHGTVEPIVIDSVSPLKESDVDILRRQDLEERFKTGDFKMNSRAVFARYPSPLNRKSKDKILAKERVLLAKAEAVYLEEKNRLELEELERFAAETVHRYGDW